MPEPWTLRYRKHRGCVGQRGCTEAVPEVCRIRTKDISLRQYTPDRLGHGRVCNAVYTLQLFLDGRGYDTFSGRNVDIMMTGDLKLTNVLLKYSSWWFLVGIIATALVVICRGTYKKMENGAFGDISFMRSNGTLYGLMVYHAGCGMLGL